MISLPPFLFLPNPPSRVRLYNPIVPLPWGGLCQAPQQPRVNPETKAMGLPASTITPVPTVPCSEAQSVTFLSSGSLLRLSPSGPFPPCLICSA